MRNRGTPTSFSPSGGDIAIWRQGIPGANDQSVYDELVHLMWPEIQNEYDRLTRPAMKIAAELTAEHPLEPDLLAAKSFSYTATDMLDDFSQDQDYNFSLFDDIFSQYINPKGYIECSPSSKESSSGSLKASPDTTGQDENHHTSPPSNTSGINRSKALSISRTDHDVPGLPECLKATAIYSIVIQFIFCKSWKKFLLVLFVELR